MKYGEDFALKAGWGTLEFRSTSRDPGPFIPSKQELFWASFPGFKTITGPECGALIQQLQAEADELAKTSELAVWLGGGDKVKVSQYGIVCFEGTPGPPPIPATATLYEITIVGK